MMAHGQAFSALRAHVGERVADRLEAHWALVSAWNERTNLTGIRDPQRAVALHYQDALEALPLWPEGTALLDVGAGAGFPGLVLALARPQATVRLLEPRRLRVAFLRHAIESLGLANVTVLQGTLAGLAPEPTACLTMRAVFSRDDQLDACVPWLTADGRLLTFRAGDSHARKKPLELTRVHRHPYAVGEPPRERHLDVWQRMPAESGSSRHRR